ncbi:HNH endonuclease [Microbispora sp. NPDC049633]|uniref:HNH endonuclease n=1 Tax=Microbispora sp. NPDC049633 TaxID=3154355 RepID=UPI0034322930
MRSAARAIRTGLLNGALLDLPPVDEEGDEEISALEGRLLLRQHVTRERNGKLRAKKIATVRACADELACEVCGFNFEHVYGPRGVGYIECHHVVPLHASGATTTKLDDLALLCSNCHRMIHRQPPWPTPGELRQLIESRTVLRGESR